MDRHELEERQHVAEEEATRLKLALPHIHLEPLSGDGDESSPSGESARERADDGQGGVQPRGASVSLDSGTAQEV